MSSLSVNFGHAHHSKISSILNFNIFLKYGILSGVNSGSLISSKSGSKITKEVPLSSSALLIVKPKFNAIFVPQYPVQGLMKSYFHLFFSLIPTSVYQ